MRFEFYYQFLFNYLFKKTKKLKKNSNKPRSISASRVSKNCWASLTPFIVIAFPSEVYRNWSAGTKLTKKYQNKNI